MNKATSKVMNLKSMCSLEDCKKLRKLIIENPDLPLLIFCGEESWNGEYAYSTADCSSGTIEEVTLYKDYWMDKQEYKEQLEEDLSEEFATLTFKEWNKMIDAKIKETEFIKAIVIYAG